MQEEQLDSALDPPARIFERLSQIAGYSWDETRAPSHSSYDNWYAHMQLCSPIPPDHPHHFQMHKILQKSTHSNSCWSLKTQARLGHALCTQIFDSVCDQSDLRRQGSLELDQSFAIRAALFLLRVGRTSQRVERRR